MCLSVVKWLKLLWIFLCVCWFLVLCLFCIVLFIVSFVVRRSVRFYRNRLILSRAGLLCVVFWVFVLFFCILFCDDVLSIFLCVVVNKYFYWCKIWCKRFRLVRARFRIARARRALVCLLYVVFVLWCICVWLCVWILVMFLLVFFVWCMFCRCYCGVLVWGFYMLGLIVCV